ncbi:TIR domain-containing protein [Rhizobium laguerreae]|uniref:TIR domain-containing protein n=1 Tax=Rhizobium TaxID=379 RepID=UPI001C8FEE58|nr:nucleotide-binding protein [Rhizobium laguerreae]MBY3233175.1 nucleotide-binding protein [Rhizobium laguerreae]
MAKFHGEFNELELAVNSTGKQGIWSEKNGHYQFKSKTGQIVNWWPSKGTLLCQGKDPDGYLAEVEAALGQPVEKPLIAEAKIFVVHGHDTEARDQLELVLLRLGLKPFILQNSDGGGKTIVEALEQSIYKDAAFGIVLLSPDDYGYSNKLADADRQPRARQNVILEMGMVMAALGRNNMAILQKGALERPSDTDGILRIEFNNHVKEIVPKLVQRLQAAGFEIPSEKIAAASA